MRKPIIAGNWKMNGSRSSIKELLDGIKAGMGDVKSAEVAVCAPAIYLADVSDQLSALKLHGVVKTSVLKLRAHSLVKFQQICCSILNQNTPL